jgi:hypothetical protein
VHQADQLLAGILELGPEVRYVAVADGQNVKTRQRHDLSGASSSESDRFEELLVNPALVLLAQQRGNIDCGGLRYLIVRYGNFAQVVAALPTGGHVSVAVEPDANPGTIAEAVLGLIE